MFGATDVTGFGLLGHLRIAMEASGASARLDAGAVPLMDGVFELAARGCSSRPGLGRTNAFVAPHTDWGSLRG